MNILKIDDMLHYICRSPIVCRLIWMGKDCPSCINWLRLQHSFYIYKHNTVVFIYKMTISTFISLARYPPLQTGHSRTNQNSFPRRVGRSHLRRWSYGPFIPLYSWAALHIPRHILCRLSPGQKTSSALRTRTENTWQLMSRGVQGVRRMEEWSFPSGDSDYLDVGFSHPVMLGWSLI